MQDARCDALGFKDDSKKISQASLILRKCRYTRAYTELDGRTIETKIFPSRRKHRSLTLQIVPF